MAGGAGSGSPPQFVHPIPPTPEQQNLLVEGIITSLWPRMEVLVAQQVRLIAGRCAGPPYVMRYKYRAWALTFAGDASAFGDEKGARLVNHLFKVQPRELVHALDLSARVLGRPVLQERNLREDQRATVRQIEACARECKAVIDDPTATEPAREEALNELERLAAARAMVLRERADGASKCVKAIRRVFPRRALVLAHREELVFQARDKIQRVTGLSADVEMGEYRAEGGLFEQARVVVSTIQTQCSGGDGGGRMAKFDPQRFGVLIIDEAHHATSPSYRRVIDYYRTNPALKILGVTATPDRADEEALGQVFQSVAFDYEVLDAIHDGWLVPIEQQLVHVQGLDYSSIRTTAGDLNGGDLAAVLEAESRACGMVPRDTDRK